MGKHTITVTFDKIQYLILKNKAKEVGINPTQYVRQSTLIRIGRCKDEDKRIP